MTSAWHKTYALMFVTVERMKEGGSTASAVPRYIKLR